MASRILRELVIDKIAAVDRPCQEHASVTIIKRAFSDDKRKDMADSGEAMPDGSFPIANKADLKNAVMAHGRASNPEAAKKHIIARAKAMGATDSLPDDWITKTAVAELLDELSKKVNEATFAAAQRGLVKLKLDVLSAQVGKAGMILEGFDVGGKKKPKSRSPFSK